MELDNRLRAIELRKAIHNLNERGLRHSVKWAAEQLVGLPREAHLDACSSLDNQDEVETNSLFLLSKSYFDLKVGCRNWQDAPSGGACQP